MFNLQIENKIKKEIVEGYAKEDILNRIQKEYGLVNGIEFLYNCCYATICREMGINLKKGENLRPKKVKIIPKK
ncbi:MAG: hypothetical protein WDA59_00490 [Methanofastidiosum sp.]|jgi:hypothetical protein|nr:hypothetical protein [Candidatus Izemoplasmatales bacterium]